VKFSKVVLITLLRLRESDKEVVCCYLGHLFEHMTHSYDLDALLEQSLQTWVIFE